MMMNISQTGTALAAGSAVMTVIATVLHAVAFGADFWLVSDGRGRPFVRLGMHEACFYQCTSPYCAGGDAFVFDGCWYYHDEQFYPIRWWLFPAWFERVRVLAIVTVPMTGVTMIVILLAGAVLAFWRYPHAKPRSRDVLLQVLLFLAAGLQFATGLLMVSIVSLFYLHAFNKDWMPIPERNSLGFCYWLEVTAIFLMCFAFVCSLTAGVFKILRMRKGPKAPEVAEDMMLGRI